MNLSAERMAFIRRQVETGAQIDRQAIEDLLGHNEHLIQLCEARFRLLLGAELETEQLKAESEALRSMIDREET